MNMCSISHEKIYYDVSNNRGCPLCSLRAEYKNSVEKINILDAYIISLNKELIICKQQIQVLRDENASLIIKYQRLKDMN